MAEIRHSLNPNAISFIPNKKSEAVREMAAKYVADLCENKKANGGKTITNEEIAKIVWHFISIGYKKLTDAEKLKIELYLNKKLHYSNFSAVRQISDSVKFTAKPPKKNHSKQLYDLSKFQMPKLSFLLVAFWGLYRHEQAQRPLLSLTYRPDAVKDSVWSVDTSDKKLWNRSCVSNECSCPPMFGYSVPSNFFGDLSHLQCTCQVQGVHLNHYRESIQGNEYILTDESQSCAVEEHVFQDIIIDIKVKADNLKEQFESTVSGLCDLLSKFSDDTISNTDGCVIDEEVQFTSFWDDIDTKVSHVPFSQQNRDSLEDDNDHPLLMTSYICNEEEVPPEVKEMIRKCLSPKEEKMSYDTVRVDEDSICDPPCSVWCGSTNRKRNINEISIAHPDMTEETKSIAAAITARLISQSKLEKLEPSNLIFSPLSEKRKIKPAFSVNDPLNGETKFDFSGFAAHISNLKTPDAFLTDPANFLNSYHRSNTWKDTDSGFVSRSSSQDNIFEGKCDHEAKSSTWELVSGEDSLWQPLPECCGMGDRMNYAHKQVRNYKRRIVS